MQTIVPAEYLALKTKLGVAFTVTPAAPWTVTLPVPYLVKFICWPAVNVDAGTVTVTDEELVNWTILLSASVDTRV